MSSTSDAAKRIVSDLSDSWNYDKWFAPSDAYSEADAFDLANKFHDEADIGSHEFFKVAASERRALELWAGQEAVVTGPFSQLLLLVGARISNVHLRASFMNVVQGEHNLVRDRRALQSHPWLLHKLCTSMNLNVATLKPMPFTLRFLNALAETTSNTMQALGALGVGNERMLIPEYGAIRNCFSSCYSDAAYDGFLMANIEEDAEHTEIIEMVARSLAISGHAAEDYYAGARVGVLARVRYYDEILTCHLGESDEKESAV